MRTAMRRLPLHKDVGGAILNITIWHSTGPTTATGSTMKGPYQTDYWSGRFWPLRGSQPWTFDGFDASDFNMRYYTDPAHEDEVDPLYVQAMRLLCELADKNNQYIPKEKP